MLLDKITANRVEKILSETGAQPDTIVLKNWENQKFFQHYMRLHYYMRLHFLYYKEKQAGSIMHSQMIKTLDYGLTFT